MSSWGWYLTGLRNRCKWLGTLPVGTWSRVSRPPKLLWHPGHGSGCPAQPYHCVHCTRRRANTGIFLLRVPMFCLKSQCAEKVSTAHVACAYKTGLYFMAPHKNAAHTWIISVKSCSRNEPFGSPWDPSFCRGSLVALESSHVDAGIQHEASRHRPQQIQLFPLDVRIPAGQADAFLATPHTHT